MIELPGAHFFLPLVDTSGPALVVELALIGLLLQGLFPAKHPSGGPGQLHHWFLGKKSADPVVPAKICGDLFCPSGKATKAKR